MKRCPICNAQYDSRIEYCFRDGARLDTPTATSTAQKLMTSHLDSMGKHSMDSMETLDNISIDDLLQIGGGGFQGFGEFAPDGPAGLNSITASLDDLQQNETDADIVDGVPSPESEDIENILESLGSDVGAHLEDTLDGVQVGQILDDSSLDMANSNEILPGDTLDVLVDEFDVPQMTESDLNRFNQHNTLDELDAWEASGPIMKEAARDALAHHRNRADDTFAPESSPSTSSGTEGTGGGNKILLVVGAAILVVSIAMWGLSGDSNTVLESETDTTTVVDQEVPEIPMVPKITVKKEKDANVQGDLVEQIEDKNAPEPVDAVNNGQSAGAVESAGSGTSVDAKNDEEDPKVKPKPDAGELISSTPVAQPKSNSTVTSVGTQSTKPQTKVPPKPAKKATPAKPKVKKKPAPQKPKTKPKPIPQKDPQEDNGWGAVQSGGWGAETCGVTVKSNVSTAKVYIDGVQKGSVGKKLSVDCGQHNMEVRSEGYQSVKRSIDLMSDASFTIDLSR